MPIIKASKEADTLIYHALLLPYIYFLIKICRIIAYTELHVPIFVLLTSPGRFQSFIYGRLLSTPRKSARNGSMPAPET